MFLDGPGAPVIPWLLSIVLIVTLPGPVWAISQSSDNRVGLFREIPFEGLADRQRVSNDELENLTDRKVKIGRYDVELVLTHPDDESKSRTVLRCRRMKKLREKGWYARSTLAMSALTDMKSRCRFASYLERARSYKKNYFQLDADQWWRNISSGVVHPPHRAKLLNRISDQHDTDSRIQKRADTFEGLGPVRSTDTSSVLIEINRYHDRLAGDTVTIWDEYYLERVALADFNGDTVAELLVFARRVPETEDAE